MIRKGPLLALSLLCLLSWGVVIGVLLDDGQEGAEVSAFILMGGVKEFTAGQGGSRSFITICTAAGDWRLPLSEAIEAPEMGRTVMLLCHPSSSGIVVDSLQLL